MNTNPLQPRRSRDESTSSNEADTDDDCEPVKIRRVEDQEELASSSYDHYDQGMIDKNVAILPQATPKELEEEEGRCGCLA